MTAPTASAEPLWWQTGVVYQIYPRSFRDADGDGVGDLPGVLERLDYLAWLGVDALWLSPFYPSPMKDFGYDVSDYRGVDPLFGTLDDFDRLLAAAHERGLKVIVDYVPNHSSDQHPWFRESRRSRDSPKRDWYLWRDAAPGGGPPNNWLSVFGGPAWTWDEATGQYFLHSFLKEQPDLNWRNPEVREALFDVLCFWLDRGVDGVRIDVAHGIMKDPEFRDNPPNPDPDQGYHKPLGDYDRQLHLYDKGHADIHGVYREMRTLIDAYRPPRVAIGEMHIYDWPRWARYYGEELDELHMPFNFALLKAPWTAAGVRASVDALEAAIPDGAWPNYVLGNHDEDRLASRLGAAQARVAAVLLLTLRGTPTLYYGDELGIENVPIPAGREQDPWGIRMPGLSRDPARTPMAWTADAPRAGFSDAPGAEPWLPLHADWPTRNVAAQRDDGGSMLALYRRLLALRARTPALRHGAYRPYDRAPEDVFAFFRTADGARYLAALNFTDTPQSVPLPDDAGRAVRVCSTHDPAEAAVGPALRLRGDEAVVVRLDG